MRRRYSMFARLVVMAGLSIGVPSVSRGQGVAASPNARMTVPPGLQEVRWLRWAARVRESGFSDADVLACADFLTEAFREGLPLEPLMLRLEEGAAKRVPLKAMWSAMGMLRDRLRQAAAVLSDAGWPITPPAGPALIHAAALALDAGLTEDSLRAVVARNPRLEQSSMRAVLEAADFLLRHGLDEATVRDLLLDFAGHGLGPPEIARACRFAIREYRRDADGHRIRARLWGSGGHRWRWGAGGADETPVPGQSNMGDAFEPEPAGGGTAGGSPQPEPGRDPASSGGAMPRGGGPGGPRGSMR